MEKSIIRNIIRKPLHIFCKLVSVILFSIFLSLLNYSASSSFAQVTSDAGLWTTFNIQKKLKNNFSLFLTEECRLKENFTRLNLFYSELGFAVKPFNALKISLAYRMIDKFLIENTFSYRHRISLDVSLKKKSGAIALSYRHRLQCEIRNVYQSANGRMPEWYSRNKFELKYALNNSLAPYMAAEFRYQISDPRNVESDKLFHRNRYIAGIDYYKNENSTIGLYYLIQNEFNVSAPEKIYILGLEYTISL